jgi:diaminohydroxyphosphoribosylaminopyrimidine deaminase/5-amino-6-(5-phosphoribosylamino)uracil reductase
MSDPDGRVSGGGFAELRAHGIAVDEGLYEADAKRLNCPFISVKTRRRPLVVLKAATSLDARVAAAPGVRTQLTSMPANRKTQLLRASVDAVAVGSETVICDDPLLTTRLCQRVRPLVRVVFDRRLRTPATARLFSTLSDGPVIIITASRDGVKDRAQALETAGATVLEAATLSDSLHALIAWDVSTILIEGGPRLQGAFWQEQLVDRLHLVVAPRMIGAGGVRWLDASAFPMTSWSRLTAETCGPDTWIEADVHGDC